MKVIGKKNDSSGLIRKEREYVVLGVLIGKIYRELNYLVSLSGDWPHWKSSKFFEVIDSDILPDWYTKMYDRNDPLCDLFFLLGFNELCKGEGYFDALIEREKWALDIYAKKYEEAIEWYELKPFMTKQISLW